MKSKATNDITERLDKLHTLKSREESATQELFRVSASLDRSSRDLVDACQRVTSLRATVNRDAENGNKRSSYVPRLTEEDNGLKATKAAVERLEQQKHDLENEITAIRNEILGCQAGISIEQVLCHQNKLEEAEDLVCRLQGIIAENEEILANVNDIQDERLEELQNRREEALAALALGEGSQDKLKAIDDDIDECLADPDGVQAEKLRTYRHAKQTISGLRVRLITAKESLERIQGMTPEVINQFLMSEAEKAGAAYMKHANEVIKCFARLNALEAIISSTTGKKQSFSAASIRNMLLPAFHLKCFDGVAKHDEAKDILFSPFTAGQRQSGNLIDFEAQKATEVTRIRDMGVTLI